MFNPNINVKKDQLLSLLKSFFELSKIKIALFDEHGYKVLAYPEDDCAFCKLMKSKEKTKKLCDESDKTSFEIVKNKKELIIYHCHANLIEASAPLMQDNVIIGYMMFGQITNESNKEKFIKDVENLLDKYQIVLKNKDIINKIKYRSDSQIKAAAQILETCTFYVLLKDYMKLANESFIQKINNYINLNIKNDISINDLASFFKISKTRLYEQFSQYSDLGIAEYIKLKRIEKAKELLVKTNLKVIEISNEIGFYDYNYFCRVFKKICGIPAKKYRTKNQN